jgi:hypothetical protein
MSGWKGAFFIGVHRCLQFCFPEPSRLRAANAGFVGVPANGTRLYHLPDLFALPFLKAV